MTSDLEAGATPRVIDVCLRYLVEEGARYIFGIPGGLLHPFFEAIEASKNLELVITKHEQGAAFMADGYARSSRKLAVCAGTSGPGATNLLTGVAVAFSDGVPMLVVTGQAASRSLGKGAAQETNREDVDIVAMFRPVTKYSTMVTSPESFSHHLRRALRQALTGRPGPVHLNVPVDLWERPLEEEEWFDPKTYRPDTRTFDRDAVQAAAEHLVSAERPLVLAGAGLGIAGAQEHLQALVELLPARVATTPRGKGLFPEDHPESLGVLGFAGHAAARDVVFSADTDVLLTVGASLNETTTFNWNPGIRPSRALLQLDIDADRIGRNYPVDVALVGDAQAILVELVYHLHRMMREGRTPASRWGEVAPPPRGDARYQDVDARTSNAHPLTPQRWRAELMPALPADAILVSDIGGHMLFNVHHLSIGEDQRFLLNLGFGSMGHGTLSPIGVALANPDRPVVAIVGDACFTMCGMDLLTAVENRVRAVWIVENNNMHGITWHGSQIVGSRRPLDSVRYKDRLHVAAIARSMGLEAWVVSHAGQMVEVFSQALASSRPSVIEVEVDPLISPPIGDRARSIAGFIR